MRHVLYGMDGNDLLQSGGGTMLVFTVGVNRDIHILEGGRKQRRT